LPRPRTPIAVAHEWGRVPQPGLARLRLAQADVDAAVAAIRLALHEASVDVFRAGLLPAYVPAQRGVPGGG